MSGKLVYISGSITHSPDWEATRRKFDLTEQVIREQGGNPFQPYKANAHLNKDSEGGRSQIFASDIEAVHNSTVVVAYMDEPSFGAGYEVCYAIGRGIPVIGIFSLHKKTPFMEAALESSKNSVVICYETTPQIWPHLRNSLRFLLE